MHSKSTSLLSLVAPFVFASSLFACGGEDPKDSQNTGGTSSTGSGGTGGGAGGSGGSAVAITQPLLPWAVGNTWQYRVTEDGVATDKVTTIGPAEALGGDGANKDLMVNKVTTKKKSGADQTISWQAPDGATRISRYKEQSFSAKTGQLELEERWTPSKVHIDWTASKVAAGSWLEDYEEEKLPVGDTSSKGSRRERWTILSLDEEVTVPAGTFHAVIFEKTGNNEAKRYWYAQGVGKVKETGGQTEELESYELKP